MTEGDSLLFFAYMNKNIIYLSLQRTYRTLKLQPDLQRDIIPINFL